MYYIVFYLEFYDIFFSIVGTNDITLNFEILIYFTIFQIKIAKVKIPTQLYYDDTPDPESGLTIEKGHAFRSHEERMCIQHEKFLEPTEEEEIEKGYMMTKEELESIKYEDPLVKKLFSCEVRNYFINVYVLYLRGHVN